MARKTIEVKIKAVDLWQVKRMIKALIGFTTCCCCPVRDEINCRCDKKPDECGKLIMAKANKIASGETNEQ